MANTANPTLTLLGPRRVELHDMPIREPGPGEIVVRTRKTLISNGTETTLYKGEAAKDSIWGALTEYPRTLGYASIGDVVAVGDARWDSYLGKRVHCHGHHQAFSTVPADKVALVPDGLRDEDATFTTLAKVAMNSLRRGQVTWGEAVGVVGLGILGQVLVRLLSHLGASLVFAFDGDETRRQMLPDFDWIIPLESAQDAAGHICDRHRGRLLDVAIEASGNGNVIGSLPDLTRDQGRLIIASSPRQSTDFDFHDGCNRKSLSIIGAHGFSHPPADCANAPWSSARHGELFMDMLVRGRVTTHELITHRFPAMQAPDAYAMLADGRSQCLGIILDWDAL